MSAISGFLIFVAIFVFTLVLFAGWVVMTIVRVLVRAIFGAPRSATQVMPPPQAGMVRCAHDGCLADNVRDAQFCRRCGRKIVPREAQHPVRRVAMF